MRGRAPRELPPYRLMTAAGVLCLLTGGGLTLAVLGPLPWLLNPMAWSHIGLSAALLVVGAIWWTRHYLSHGRSGRTSQRRTGQLQTLLWSAALISGLFFFPVMGDPAGTLVFRWVHGLLAGAALAAFALHTRARGAR